MAVEQTKCGAWTLGREIGRGAYGVVYWATGPQGAKAAVKVCARDAADRERYERERRGAKLYRSIPASEGLVRLLDFGESDWGFYLAMELADDEFGAGADEAGYRPKTLSHVIAGEKALPVGDCLKLGIALAEGLATLQSHHLLHRDVKPGNVVYVRGRPVLSDPGLLVDEAEAASLVGTPGYVPPENFTGAGGDVYSLGLTLKAASFGRTVDDLARGPTLEADTASPLFPAWWRILNKATHPDAAQRYRSAKALLKDLRALHRRSLLSPLKRRLALVADIVLGVAVVLIFLYLYNQMRVRDDYVEEQAAEARAAAKKVLRDTQAHTEQLVRELQQQKDEQDARAEIQRKKTEAVAEKALRDVGESSERVAREMKQQDADMDAYVESRRTKAKATAEKVLRNVRGITERLPRKAKQRDSAK